MVANYNNADPQPPKGPERLTSPPSTIQVTSLRGSSVIRPPQSFPGHSQTTKVLQKRSTKEGKERKGGWNKILQGFSCILFLDYKSKCNGSAHLGRETWGETFWLVGGTWGGFRWKTHQFTWGNSSITGSWLDGRLLTECWSTAWQGGTASAVPPHLSSDELLTPNRILAGFRGLQLSHDEPTGGQWGALPF